jgi:hypothetical protein
VMGESSECMEWNGHRKGRGMDGICIAGSMEMHSLSNKFDLTFVSGIV